MIKAEVRVEASATATQRFFADKFDFAGGGSGRAEVDWPAGLRVDQPFRRPVWDGYGGLVMAGS